VTPATEALLCNLRKQLLIRILPDYRRHTKWDAMPHTIVTSLALSASPGPEYSLASAVGVGLEGETTTRYSVPAGLSGEFRATLPVADVPHEISSDSQLVYAIFPRFAADAAAVGDAFGSTAVALDILCSDGTRLSDVAARDQYGFPATARGQFEAKNMLADQWNLLRIDVGALAGKRVESIEVVVFVPDDATPVAVVGWIDAVRFEQRMPLAPRPSDRVRTTRGSHSAGMMSRGNTLPAVAVPNGFTFGVPVTNAREFSWVYSYHSHNRAGNRPALEAFAVSHMPSPWIGERGAFQVMPSSAPGRPSGVPGTRALTFSHHNETDRPHLYEVGFDSGLVASMTATDHALILRFVFPDDNAVLIFDQIDGKGRIILPPVSAHPVSVLTGYIDGIHPNVPSAPRAFVHVEIDAPVLESGMLGEPGHENVRGYVRVAAGSSRTVVVRIGTSFIGTEQAAVNLHQEISDGEAFESVVERAQSAWDARLAVVEIDGASDDQQVTLASNLYRLFLFPNSSSENVGTPDSPDLRYASPFHRPRGRNSPSHTGCRIESGSLFVNNGLWDTYRTAWQALTLFDPASAGHLLDGLVQHYRDGGWTPRWTAPGYVDCMTGTSTDIALANAIVAGVSGLDERDAYDSALRNASAPSDDPLVGRKGIEHSLFDGYVSTDVAEGMSWTIDAAINDYGLFRMSEHLLESAAADDPRREEFRANAVWFRSRALGYRRIFDPSIGFFQGVDRDGRFRLSPGEYDPRVWGYDYTETNGWGTAFTVPHDGAGLAALHGGPAGLEAKLDEFFRTPETADTNARGSYTYTIHELTEARDQRMGMLALSNQPAHHIPYMYLFAGAPHKTQAITREALSRLFVGSEIGQGYPGDEDNGEMSAWYVLSALGLYPLTVASGFWAITSPLYRHARVTLASGAVIRIDAPSNSRENVYIQSLRINGEPWASTAVAHSVLAAGAHLEFELGPVPSDWGSGPDAAPPSLSDTPGAQLADLTGRDGWMSSSAAAIDNSSATAGVELATGASVTVTSPAPFTATLYTVTPRHSTSETGPVSWVVEAQFGGEWTVVDTRTDERFLWGRQTRPFLVQGLAGTTAARLRVTSSENPWQVVQFELLGAGG
jgi:predicted alpha-1,2-mannosidase